jgi:hypothetical protein
MGFEMGTSSMGVGLETGADTSRALSTVLEMGVAVK